MSELAPINHDLAFHEKTSRFYPIRTLLPSLISTLEGERPSNIDRERLGRWETVVYNKSQFIADEHEAMQHLMGYMNASIKSCKKNEAIQTLLHFIESTEREVEQ